MSIPRLSTKKPVAVAMLTLALIFVGGISAIRLPIDLLPDVSFPRLVIHTVYPDVAPPEVERLVTERVESAVSAVPGVEQVTSVSQEGVSLVTARFSWGTNMDFAALNVRERLDEIREALPESAVRPTILRVDPQAEPILAISVSGGRDLWETKEVAETVFRRRLEQIDGVAQASVTGGLDREIHVETDIRRMDALGVSMADVEQALDGANYSAPGGTVMRGRSRFPLRTLGEFQSVAQIEDVVVGVRRSAAPGTDTIPGERPIRISDIGWVEDGFADRETIARYNGSESVGILVFKESGANTVTVSELVQEALDLLATQYPEFDSQIASSQAGFIRDSINNVVQALVLGGALAFLVLFFFLRDPRYPVAVALAIPISVVTTFALMDASGVSLNIMSLGGLALGVGMLVDNSIIVLENIFRHRQAGLGAMESAARGAEEVQGAITASTLTTISVFGPIIYVEGVAGQLFGSLSLAVAFSLLASLLVALTLLPALAGRALKDGSPRVRRAEEILEAGEAPLLAPKRAVWRIAILIISLPWHVIRLALLALGFVLQVLRQLVGFWAGIAKGVFAATLGPATRSFDRGFSAFAEGYHRVLESALDRKAAVLGVAATALGSVLALGLLLERDLLPDVDQGAFDVRIELPRGATLEATNEAARRVEEALLSVDEVEAVFSRVGRDVRAFADEGDVVGVNTALLRVRLAEGAETDAVLNETRRRVGSLESATVGFESGQATALGQILGGSEADIALRVVGENIEETYPFALGLRDTLAGVASIRNVRVGSGEGQPQYQVDIDRIQSARYNLQPRMIASTIETAMRGSIATEYVAFDRKIPIVVRLPDEQRFDEETLRYLRLNGIPLREVVTLEQVMAPAEIRRENQGRVVTVYADVQSGGLATAIADVESAVQGVRPPDNARIEVGGENEEMQRSFRDLAFAFGLALLLVYMILAAQFESFIQPLTILVAVPLALVGAILALVLAGQGLNTMSLIGVVILVGIVVNDAIVKVDFIIQRRAQGKSLREAVLDAGRVRLRPIVMTTVTTVLGLLPMALGIGRGADLRAPLAVAVIGGLIVATLLTLIVVPVVYASLEGLRARLRRS